MFVVHFVKFCLIRILIHIYLSNKEKVQKQQSMNTEYKMLTLLPSHIETINRIEQDWKWIAMTANIIGILGPKVDQSPEASQLVADGDGFASAMIFKKVPQ